MKQCATPVFLSHDWRFVEHLRCDGLCGAEAGTFDVVSSVLKGRVPWKNFPLNCTWVSSHGEWAALLWESTCKWNNTSNVDDQDVGVSGESCYLTHPDKAEPFWIEWLESPGLFRAVYLLSFWGVLTTSLSNFTHRYFLEYWSDGTWHHFEILWWHLLWFWFRGRR